MTNVTVVRKIRGITTQRMPINQTHSNRLKQKAASTLKQGNISKASRTLLKLCHKNPDDLEAWIMLISAYGQQGDFDAVVKYGHKALSLNPGNPQINSILGNAFACLGRHEEALAHYCKALEYSPNDPGILNNLGNALYLAGQLENAAEKLTLVVQLMPDYADAHNNLGNIYKALNKNNKAISHFERAIALNPKLIEGHLNLGGIYNDRLGFPRGAEHCFREALRLKPDSIEAKWGLANSLRFEGRLDESMTVIQSVLKVWPNNATAIASEADNLERQGKFKAALERVNILLEKNEMSPMAVDVLTRVCGRYDCCDKAIKAGERLLGNRKIEGAGRQTLLFSLGKLHDKLGNYDTAFEYFREGNDMTGAPFKPAKLAADFNTLITTFSLDTLKTIPAASNHDTRPVFIVGMPRSGTSLTEQILASHPDIFGAGELNDINDIVARIPALFGRNSTYPECIKDLKQEVANKLAQEYLTRLDTFSTEARRITDKMPHNFVNLGLISLLFPEARIIHCLREPRDTCLSLYFQDFGWIHPYATNLETLGNYYVQYMHLMKHWESALDIPMLTIHYEDIVADQEHISRELIDFCGLDWHDDCLQFYTSKRTVATASYDQVRQPIYKKSIARWKNYEQHLDPLTEALGEQFTKPHGAIAGYTNNLL